LRKCSSATLLGERKKQNQRKFGREGEREKERKREREKERKRDRPERDEKNKETRGKKIDMLSRRQQSFHLANEKCAVAFGWCRSNVSQTLATLFAHA